VRLGAIDDISLEVGGTVIERLEAPALSEEALAEEAEEDAELAAPIAIQMDLGEEDAAPAAGSAAPTAAQ
jgi:exoribonuclease-2